MSRSGDRLDLGLGLEHDVHEHVPSRLMGHTCAPCNDGFSCARPCREKQVEGKGDREREKRGTSQLVLHGNSIKPIKQSAAVTAHYCQPKHEAKHIILLHPADT